MEYIPETPYFVYNHNVLLFLEGEQENRIWFLPRVHLCTTGVHDQIADIYIQGILKDPLDAKY